MHRLGEFGTGAMLDREFFEVKAGETKTIRWVRDKGARLRGKVTWPAGTVLAGIIVSVRAEKAEKGPFDDHEWQTTYASQDAAADGTYPDRADRAGQLPARRRGVQAADSGSSGVSTGVIGPAFRAEMKLEVPGGGGSRRAGFGAPTNDGWPVAMKNWAYDRAVAAHHCNSAATGWWSETNRPSTRGSSIRCDRAARPRTKMKSIFAPARISRNPLEVLSPPSCGLRLMC